MKLLQNWWIWITKGWLLRSEEVEKLRANFHTTDDALKLAKLEITHLHSKLSHSDEELIRARDAINRLTDIIIKSHRLNVQGANGTILKVLQEARRQ